MAEYKQIETLWLGHSINDTPPSASSKTGHFRLDTDLVVLYYSNGTTWITIATGPAAVIEFTNKTIDMRKNPILRLHRYGVYTPSEESKAVGQGGLAGLVGIGDKTNNINTGGKYDIWSTKAVIDDCAGVVKLDTFISFRLSNPLLRFAWLFPGSKTNRREFKGVGAKRLINTNSATAPLNSNENGFMFGYGSDADTNFQIFHNDATNTCVKVDTGLAIPAIATNYILEIQFNDASGGSVTWTLYSVTSGSTPGLGIRGSVLGTGTISSRIPGSNTHLYIQDLVVATNASIQPNNIHCVEVFA